MVIGAMSWGARGGGSAVEESELKTDLFSPEVAGSICPKFGPGALQRCFRDLHASTQHLMVDNNTLTDTTRTLLEAEA